MELQDALAPTIVEQPSGPLFEPVAAGAQTVKMAAEDKGGGLASATLLVDGRPVATAAPDAPAQSCAPPYVKPVPCPLASSFHLDVDTRTLGNGAHDVQVEVADAAGNTTRTPSRPVVIRNDGAANGALATRLAVLSGQIVKASRATPLRRLVNVGHKIDLTGRLTDASGVPIAGATLVVDSRIDRPGEPWRRVGDVVTDDGGRWAAAAGSGASRQVRVSYRAFAADPAPATELVATVRVRAGLTLTVSPRRTSPAGRIVFRGRLIGGPGRARTQVTLYAVPGRGRRPIPVTVLSASEDGRFRYAYRFSGAYSNVRYTFQARVKSQPGYPYAAGASKKVTVNVRG
jgi:hypothetical protein